MDRFVRQSLLMLVVLTAFTGIVFPLIVTGIARVLFADAADARVIDREGWLMAATAADAPRDVASKDSDGDAAKGNALFVANCSPCHQASGEGVPGAFPSLKGNNAVNRPDPTAQIRVVLYGLRGVRVGGVVYATPMPPFGATLDDADIASIINYERSAWGNNGTHVSAAMVATQRARGQ